MNKTIITWLAIVVLVVAGILIFKNSNTTPTNTELEVGGQSAAPGTNTATSPTDTATGTTSTIPTPSVKSFTVTGKPFSFTPSTMTVNMGDRVKITFVNEAGTHDWVIDEFNARTKVLQGGQTQTIEFVADKTGSFEYYCSVGTHRQMGMKGTLIVK